MELSFQSGLIIENPTADDIRDHLPTEIYAILERKPGFYLQCHLKFPWPAYGAQEFKVMPRLHGRIRKSPALPAWSRALPNQGYLLEYQDGTLAEHFQALNHVKATEQLVTLQEVIDCFCKFLRADESWRTDFEWSKMNLSEVGDEPSSEE
jgi:hypothetical protein